ncbi:hypothetical protein BUALT_Bualt09G0083800 [Buddleja alternifolia]|uniref:B box-type domain-containing protein n=1 Tax=Buddleja alternifolia TaxID=168488 RepID=A0AAV6X0Z3_9LAMI|nr:hypothetical protein BUALT_Bualt09G0083800 [Buddleja alternifolia]
MLVPPWVEKLLNTAFFNVCRTHSDAARSECNMYCLDCNVDAFCFYCRSSKHKDHQLVGIKGNGDARFTLDAKSHEVIQQRSDQGISTRRVMTSSSSRLELEEELREGSQQDIYPPTPPPPPSSGRRRKGIPQRAPFWS